MYYELCGVTPSSPKYDRSGRIIPTKGPFLIQTNGKALKEGSRVDAIYPMTETIQINTPNRNKWGSYYHNLVFTYQGKATVLISKSVKIVCEAPTYPWIGRTRPRAVAAAKKSMVDNLQLRIDQADKNMEQNIASYKKSYEDNVKSAKRQRDQYLASEKKHLSFWKKWKLS